MKKVVLFCILMIVICVLCGCSYRSAQDDYASHLDNYAEQASGLESSSQESASSMDEFVNSILSGEE